jgi:hypothetical protein
MWIAKAGVSGGAWRRAREVATARVWRNAAYGFTSTPAVLIFDSIERDPYGLYGLGSGLFTCPVAGLYEMTGHIALTVAAGSASDIRAQKTGAMVYTGGGMTGSAGVTGRMLGATGPFLCAAGDTLGWQIWSNMALAGVTGQNLSWAVFSYRGSA